MENTSIDWQHIGRELAAPVDPDAVSWRVEGRPEKRARRQIVPYLDARDVQDRLDAAVGPGGWSFTWEALVIAEGELRVVKGRLEIYGRVREEVGTASNFEASKGAVSDALKRCGVAFGIGRDLYQLPAVFVQLDDAGRIPASMLAALRERLAKHAAVA